MTTDRVLISAASEGNISKCIERLTRISSVEFREAEDGRE